MNKSLIIASSVNHAHMTAVMDWGWERLGAKTYQDGTGDVIEVVPPDFDFKRLPRGTKVYTGFGWHTIKYHTKFRAMFNAGRIRHISAPSVARKINNKEVDKINQTVV